MDVLRRVNNRCSLEKKITSHVQAPVFT